MPKTSIGTPRTSINRRHDMNPLEIAAIAVAACGLLLFFSMLPDIRRYMKIRSM
jgi:hypothetical protein